MVVEKVKDKKSTTKNRKKIRRFKLIPTFEILE